MRIALLTNNYKPYIGGVPVSVELLAEALRARGHTVYVFAPSYRGQEDEDYVMRYPSLPFSIAGAPVPNVCTGAIGRALRELDIELIHVHHPALAGNVALAMRRRLGAPVVFTYHTRYEEYLHYIGGLRSLERYTGILDRYLRMFCERCDTVFAPTPGIRDDLKKKGVTTPVEVVPTGISAESFRVDAGTRDALRGRELSGADYLLVTVSRLAREKNLEFQLAGLACLKRLLKKRGRTFRHLVLGDGPDRERLERMAAELGLAEEVRFAGSVAHDRIRDYCAAADAFVFTSRSETQGIVLLEAMAAGTPVVAVAASGVDDLVVHGENGYRTAEDAHEWASYIARCLSEEGLRQELGSRARQTAAAYVETSVAERAEQCYRETLLRFRRTMPGTIFGGV